MVGWQDGAPVGHRAGMWPVPARARRLLRRSSDVDDITIPEPVDDVDAGAPCPEMVVSLARPEVDRLAVALQGLLGPGTTRPDTPARLEAALAAAVERMGGAGRPRVVRRPAGLTTPGAWQIALTGVDPTIVDDIRAATRGRPWPVDR